MSQSIYFPREIYVQRRAQLSTSLSSGKILLLGNGHTAINFKDNYNQFRQDSCFLYYLGINLPYVHAVIDIDNEQVTLYGDEVTMDDIIWIGDQEPLQQIAEAAGISKVKPLAQLSADLTGKIYYLPPYRAEHKLLLSQLLDTHKLSPSTELIKSIAEQRNTKAPEEIKELHRAATISNRVHEQVIRQTHIGCHEYELVAKATEVAYAHQTRWAYSPILTTQGQILHNHNHSLQAQEGDMILFDGGVELESGYCGDLTRTFPVGNKFTSLQKELYQITLDAYKTAVDLCHPGTAFKSIHLKASEKLVEGLIALGWMKGDPEEAVAAGAHTVFFQCGLGHMIGLDVHDMENLGEEYVGYDGEAKSTEFGLKSLRLGRNLKTGYCMTIEPGIYVIPQLIDLWAAENKHASFIDYKQVVAHKDFGGIRIEDDFTITENGAEKLGDHLALEISEIENLRAANLS